MINFFELSIAWGLLASSWLAYIVYWFVSTTVRDYD